MSTISSSTSHHSLIFFIISFSFTTTQSSYIRSWTIFLIRKYLIQIATVGKHGLAFFEWERQNVETLFQDLPLVALDKKNINILVKEGVLYYLFIGFWTIQRMGWLSVIILATDHILKYQLRRLTPSMNFHHLCMHVPRLREKHLRNINAQEWRDSQSKKSQNYMRAESRGSFQITSSILESF